MAESELFVAKNLLGVSQGWQEMIEHAPTPQARRETIHEACVTLNGIAGQFSPRRVFVRSETAIMFSPDPENPRLMSAVQFEEIEAKGHLGRIVFMSMDGHGSIAWPLYDAQVLNLEETEVYPYEEPDEDEVRLPTDKIRRPLHLPVRFIDYALWAA